MAERWRKEGEHRRRGWDIPLSHGNGARSGGSGGRSEGRSEGLTRLWVERRSRTSGYGIPLKISGDGDTADEEQQPKHHHVTPPSRQTVVSANSAVAVATAGGKRLQRARACASPRVSVRSCEPAGGDLPRTTLAVGRRGGRSRLCFGE